MGFAEVFWGKDGDKIPLEVSYLLLYRFYQVEGLFSALFVNMLPMQSEGMYHNRNLYFQADIVEDIGRTSPCSKAYMREVPHGIILLELCRGQVLVELWQGQEVVIGTKAPYRAVDDIAHTFTLFKQYLLPRSGIIGS